jgi:uncharacterized protein
MRGDAILIRLNAPPVDGAANEALIAFLSDALGVPRRNIRLIAGEKSRDKRVRIEGISQRFAVDLLQPPPDTGRRGNGSSGNPST